LLEIQQLHVEFQEHEGAQDLSPLHLTLASYPNIIKQLKHLKEAAASGRGLSSIGTDVGEHAENITGEHQEDEPNVLDAQAPEGANEDPGVDENTYLGDVSDQPTAVDNVPINSFDNPESPSQKRSPDQPGRKEQSQNQDEDFEQDTSQDSQQRETGAATPGPSSVQDSHEPQSIESTQEHEDENKDEDGDLIDYSEDEEENEEAAVDSQNVSSGSSTLQGDDQPDGNGMYQASNQSPFPHI
jgi:hypothetical protein